MRIDERNSSLAHGLNSYRRSMGFRISANRNKKGSLIVLYIAITFVVIALLCLAVVSCC